MSRRSTEEILLDALGHFDRMQAHAGHDLEDQLVIDAVCMRLSAGIETLATLDPAVRADLFGEDWRLMWGHAEPDRPWLPARGLVDHPPNRHP